MFWAGTLGPHWGSGYASGCVTDVEAVKQTSVYRKTVAMYPEIKNWPTLCVVYVGAGLPFTCGTVDASDYDLEIMSRTGTKILDEPNVNHVSIDHQMLIQV